MFMSLKSWKCIELHQQKLVKYFQVRMEILISAAHGKGPYSFPLQGIRSGSIVHFVFLVKGMRGRVRTLPGHWQ